MVNTQIISAPTLTKELKFDDRLFPRQPKFASKAGQLILELSEHGLQQQTILGKRLHLLPYEMSRMLDNLSPYVYSASTPGRERSSHLPTTPQEDSKLANWFVCPLCGHQRRIEGWDPEGYDDEIKIRDVRGLGKGHGSSVASEWTADGNSAGFKILRLWQSGVSR